MVLRANPILNIENSCFQSSQSGRRKFGDSVAV